MKKNRLVVIRLLVFIFPLNWLWHVAPQAPAWSVSRNGNILEISYGSDSDYPQYAALHLDSSYLRMNYGPGSGWGTSVVLFPSFWERAVEWVHAATPGNVEELVALGDLVFARTADSVFKFNE